MNKASVCGVGLMMSLALIAMPGCSKKAIQSGGDSQPAQGMAKEGIDSSMSGVGTFPDTSGQSVGGGLGGIDKNPSEERLGGGTMMAKLDPSGAGRQLDEIRAEQAASAAAGLRDVFFGYDSWTISEDGRQALTRDAEWMKSNVSALV